MIQLEVWIEFAILNYKHDRTEGIPVVKLPSTCLDKDLEAAKQETYFSYLFIGDKQKTNKHK